MYKIIHWSFDVEANMLKKNYHLFMYILLLEIQLLRGRMVSGLTKPGEVGDFFTLVSMKSPNFCQKAKF